MTATLLQELIDQPDLLHRLRVDEYDRLIVAGLVEEGAPFELLDGQVVRKLRNAAGESPKTIATGHATVTIRLADLNASLKPLGCHIRVQLPVSLPPHDMPEPDGLIVRGLDAAYTQRHPSAADVLCVIEVADASLRRDRGSELEVYARNGLPTYLIFNLIDRVVETFAEPNAAEGRYGRSGILLADANISFPTLAGPPLVVAVQHFMP